ncbi:hypothetical protein D3C80_2073300 [compost metagenome]
MKRLFNRCDHPLRNCRNIHILSGEPAEQGELVSSHPAQCQLLIDHTAVNPAAHFLQEQIAVQMPE